MTTVDQVIRAAIPSADADTVQFIMWSRTPFPCGKVSARSVYRAASGWRRASDNGIRLCDHCDNRAIEGQWECQQCSDALRSAREASWTSLWTYFNTHPALSCLYAIAIGLAVVGVWFPTEIAA